MTARPDATRLAAGVLLRAERIAGPHLLVLEGPGPERRVPLGKGLTVGRGQRAELRLDDPAASRLHLRVAREGAGFVAIDLGARNGLWVNGRPCRSPRALRFGDELAIGRTRVTLDAGALAELAGPVESDPNPPGVGEPTGGVRASGTARWALAAAALLAGAAVLLAV